MSNIAKLLFTVSRPEFLPANSASLVIGVAWGLTLPVDILGGLVVPLFLAFLVTTLVAAYAAQINSLADYELDHKDPTKKDLTAAMNQLNRRKLKAVMFTELALSLALLAVLIMLQGKIALLIPWIAAVFLAHTYSAPPLRLKARGILAPITLLFVLSILPVTFVAYTFTTTLDFAFWLFLAGQALTVYGVIVPAEIRDYFGDKRMGIVTFTVQLGLVKASAFGIALLSIGGALCAAGLALKLAFSVFPWLSIALVVMAAAYLYILRKYWKLLKLSKKHAQASAESQSALEQEIVNVAVENPKWITLVTQSIVLLCIVLIISKLL